MLISLLCKNVFLRTKTDLISNNTNFILSRQHPGISTRISFIIFTIILLPFRTHITKIFSPFISNTFTRLYLVTFISSMTEVLLDTEEWEKTSIYVCDSIQPLFSASLLARWHQVTSSLRDRTAITR